MHDNIRLNPGKQFGHGSPIEQVRLGAIGRAIMSSNCDAFNGLLCSAFNEVTADEATGASH